MRIPKYRRHSTGKGFVEWGGKRHYFPGTFNSPESVAAYKRFIRPLVDDTKPGIVLAPGEPLTIYMVAAKYMTEARTWTAKRGTPSPERYHVDAMVRFLVADHGSLPIAEFGPKALRAVRDKMIEARKVKAVSKTVNGKTTWVRRPTEGRLSRAYINDQVARVKRFFWWAAAEEYVPASVAESLRAIRSITRGDARRMGAAAPPEARKVRPADAKAIAAARAHMSPTLLAMSDTLQLTGMRPDELCIMRPMDLDRGQKIWEYRPSRFKTEHAADERVYFLGPRVQKILAPLLGREPEAFLFSPRESVSWFNEQRWKAAKTTKRRIPKTSRRLNDCFTPGSFRQALARATRKANAAHWFPYQVRHLHGTNVRKRFKLEGAQVALGHARADVTQLYAERDQDLARRIAAEIG